MGAAENLKKYRNCRRVEDSSVDRKFELCSFEDEVQIKQHVRTANVRGTRSTRILQWNKIGIMERMCTRCLGGGRISYGSTDISKNGRVDSPRKTRSI